MRFPGQLRDLIGRDHVTREEDNPTQIELAGERAKIGWNRISGKPGDGELPDVTTNVAKGHASVNYSRGSSSPRTTRAADNTDNTDNTVRVLCCVCKLDPCCPCNPWPLMRAVEGKGGQHLLERSHQIGHDGLTHRERKFQPVTVVLRVRDVAGDENVAGAVADE